ncbi:MAG: hypothetical protein P8103_00790 [Candidatus Thiodiazotropha sp.]|jgi:hypothetical protein
MKMFCKMPIIAVLSLALSGCAGVAHTYKGDEKPASEVAILNSEYTEFSGETYFVSFVAYVDMKDEEKTKNSLGDEIIGYPKEIHMLPGEYMLMNKCWTLHGTAFVPMRIKVDAGKKYKFTCAPAMNKMNTIQMKYGVVD